MQSHLILILTILKTMINQLATNALASAIARYDQKTLKPSLLPESGFITEIVGRTAKIQTNQGYFFARSSSSGGGGIGDHVALHIVSQGTNFYNVKPR